MAIVVLVLWLFTAGAGFYLLVTSNLGRARPAASDPRRPSQPQPRRVGHGRRGRTRRGLGRRPRRQAPAVSATPAAAAPAGAALPRSARCGGRRGTGSTRPR